MDDDSFSVSKIIRWVFIGIIGLILLFTFFGSFYTIDQGQVGVVLTNGRISSDSGPGLHFKLPWVQSIKEISTQIQRDAFENQGDKADYRMFGYTQDQQRAYVSISINYHVTDPNEVYSQFGSITNMEKRVIDPRANEQVRNILGHYTAQDAIQKRANFNADVTRSIQKAVNGPVIVDSVQIESIDFSGEFDQAVEQRMKSIIAQQQALADKQKRMTNADAAKYEKEAQADATLYTQQAEAKGIQAKGDALRSNPEIVSLTAVQNWDGHLPTTMVPGSSVPFIDVKAH